LVVLGQALVQLVLALHERGFQQGRWPAVRCMVMALILGGRCHDRPRNHDAPRHPCCLAIGQAGTPPRAAAYNRRPHVRARRPVLLRGHRHRRRPCGQCLCAGSWPRPASRCCWSTSTVFPRDKVCGDGLIPDAHAALRRLGVLDEVMDQAAHVPHVRCVGAARRPRRRARHAGRAAPAAARSHPAACRLRAGATPCMPARFEAPLLDGDRVIGARLKVGGVGHEVRHEVRARWVVIATGAVPQGVMAAEVCERRTPSGVALRGYVHHPGLVGRITGLEIVWHKRLAGGYGWIFPVPGRPLQHRRRPHRQPSGRTGAGGRLKMQDVNLRQMFDTFCEVYAPARELMAGGTLQGELKGAPLRCSLNGARWSRPGLLVTGEAAGSTYAFSGEGIGKAMETGLLAAEALVADQTSTDADTRARYEASLRALLPRFDLYDKASTINHHPWLADLVIWRARPQPAHPAAHGRRAGGDAEPGPVAELARHHEAAHRVGLTPCASCWA
jgi:hypothetical protein